MQYLFQQSMKLFIALCILFLSTDGFAFAATTITPGADWSGGSSGFGAGLSTDLASFGGASVQSDAVILSSPHSTTFGLGADAIVHPGRVFFGAGANVLFPTCAGCQTSFAPDVLVGTHLVGDLGVAARYYISTRSENSGIFFAGLQIGLP